jgi:hypothetical protein
MDTGQIVLGMSFDRHYPNRKDHRKPYRGSRLADISAKEQA